MANKVAKKANIIILYVGYVESTYTEANAHRWDLVVSFCLLPSVFLYEIYIILVRKLIIYHLKSTP